MYSYLVLMSTMLKLGIAVSTHRHLFEIAHAISQLCRVSHSLTLHLRQLGIRFQNTITVALLQLEFGVLLVLLAVPGTIHEGVGVSWTLLLVKELALTITMVNSG